MSATVNVYDFSQLERSLLGIENMELSGTLIDKVPSVAGSIVVNDFFRERDEQVTLAIIPHGEGTLEIIRDNEAPISIDYFDVNDPRTPIQVLSSPVKSLVYSPIGFCGDYELSSANSVLNWTGLEHFTRLVAGRAVKKQKQAGVITRTYANVG